MTIIILDLKSVLEPTATPTTPEDTEGDCPDETWERYGEHCYYFYPHQDFFWDDAQAECVRLGGQDAMLASIHSSTENYYILGKLINETGPTGRAWIGMNKIDFGEQLLLQSFGKFTEVLCFHLTEELKLPK